MQASCDTDIYVIDDSDDDIIIESESLITKDEKFDNERFQFDAASDSTEPLALLQYAANDIIAISESSDSESNEPSNEPSTVNRDPYVYQTQYCLNCNETTTTHRDLIQKACKWCNTKLLFECVICGRRYDAWIQVYMHLRAKIDCLKSPDLECSECDYTTLHKGLLRHHIFQRHTLGIQDLKSCSKCGRHFTRQFSRDEHEISCGMPPYLECNFCDFTTKTGLNFKVHVRKHHILDPDNGAALVDLNFKPMTVDPTYETSDVYAAGFSKKDRNKLKRTKKKQMSTRKYLDLNCRGMIKMYCYKCKETTPVRVKKNKECPQCQTVLIHECGLCSRKFNTYINLINHIQDRHSGRDLMNLYICGWCNKNFDSHKKASHHEVECNKIDKCDLCAFKAKRCYVRRHKEKWHDGPDRVNHHPCPKCGWQMRLYTDKMAGAQCSHCR